MSGQLRWNGHVLALELRRLNEGHAVVYNGIQHAISSSTRTGTELELTLDEVAMRYRVYADRDTVWIASPDGIYRFERVDATAATAPDSDSGTSSLISRMPGRVLRRAVEPGARVVKGQALVVLEAMKMEHEVTAPCDGTVEGFPQEEGAPIMPGDLLVTFVPDPAGGTGL